MTLALIAVIVFLIVWGCQVGDIKAKKKEYQKKTRTNLVLEKEIYQKVEDEISSRLNAESVPVGEIYPRLLSLFDEYGVAYHPFSFQWGIYTTREEFIANQMDECRKDEFNTVENTDSKTTIDRIRLSYIIRESYHFYGQKNATKASRLEATYRYLLSEITRKRMNDLGYAFSKDGIHESEWQEREKQHEDMELLKEKYPYLFR